MIARGPGGAIASFWAASNVPAVVDRVPPERSALTALSASAGSGLRGATTRGSPPDATMVRTPSGSRSRNSVAPLCAASNTSGGMSDAVSITRATDRLRDAMGVTVVVTGLPLTVTDNASGASPRSCCAAGTARTIETRGADAVCTAITRGSPGGAARAGYDTKGASKRKASVVNTATVAARPRSSRLSSKDHQIVTVVSGGRIEWASAGHQSEFRFNSRVVDELAGKLGLVISLQRGHQEAGRGPVCAFDQNLVPGLKLAEPEEHRGSRLGVDVPQDDRRTDLARPRAAGPPARGARLPRYLDALVGCPRECLQPRVHVDRGDAQANRGSSLAVRAR